MVNNKMETALNKFKRKYRQKEYNNINKDKIRELIKALDNKIDDIQNK